MPFSTPHTWSVGEVATAALLNSDLRDNINYLKALYDAIAGMQQQSVGATFENTTSTTPTNLATVGPTVNVTTGPVGAIVVGCNAEAKADVSGHLALFGFEVKQAATLIVAAGAGYRYGFNNGTDGDRFGFTSLILAGDGIVPSTNYDLTMKYWCSAGTGSFAYRTLWAIPI